MMEQRISDDTLLEWMCDGPLRLSVAQKSSLCRDLYAARQALAEAIKRAEAAEFTHVELSHEVEYHKVALAASEARAKGLREALTEIAEIDFELTDDLEYTVDGIVKTATNALTQTSIESTKGGR